MTGYGVSSMILPTFSVASPNWTRPVSSTHAVIRAMIRPGSSARAGLVASEVMRIACVTHTLETGPTTMLDRKTNPESSAEIAPASRPNTAPASR